ncbi:hypothetical protein [Streptomyces sp. NBC_00354]|uniref:hypothetical protein n=1 Tax=Streptomyces sp. NBC_00354 TaxID=2975723 RepID=UPI002E276B7D
MSMTPPHPQQQAYPGSGYPGQPYPPQPYHGQGGWGQPPMGPPPGSGSRTGYDSKVRNPEPATARYTSGSPKEPGVLALSGMYGQFKDPAGSRRKMTAGATSTLPMCARADENTSASVAVVTAEITEQDPASVDLEQPARATVKVRAEARQPIN